MFTSLCLLIWSQYLRPSCCSHPCRGHKKISSPTRFVSLTSSTFCFSSPHHSFFLANCATKIKIANQNPIVPWQETFRDTATIALIGTKLNRTAPWTAPAATPWRNPDSRRPDRTLSQEEKDCTAHYYTFLYRVNYRTFPPCSATKLISRSSREIGTRFQILDSQD